VCEEIEKIKESMYSYPLQPVEEALQEFLPDFDHQVVEVLLATIIANWADGPPIWLTLVAPASLGKTTILEPLGRVKGARILSKLTPRTLLSGSKPKAGGDPSLLTRLGKRPFLVIKELSTLLQGDPHSRGEIFAQLREVFDGHFVMDFGNGVTRNWEGKAVLVAGITPQVDKYMSFETNLGERFIKLRFESGLDPEALALAAWAQVGDEDATKEALHTAYKYAIERGIDGLKQVALSGQARRKLAALASFIATTRTHVDRNQYRKDRIEMPPAVEGTPRLMKNLGLIAQGLCALHGWVDVEDFSALHRIGYDCMPEPRRSILMRVVSDNTKDIWPCAADLNGVVSESYVYQVLTDLEMIGVVAKRQRDNGGPGRPIHEYALSETMTGLGERSGMLKTTRITKTQ
jgi:hypothetical protein